jgi:hypothetical protein
MVLAPRATARLRTLDAGRDAVKGQLQVREVGRGKHAAQHVAERVHRVQMRARTRQPHRAAPQGPAERLPHRIALPHLAQPGRRARRVSSHERAVDGADRRAHDHVGCDASV